MSITNNGNTSTIDSSYTAAQLATQTLEPNLVILRDSGTPVGDPVVVDLSGLTTIPDSVAVRNAATAVLGSTILFGAGVRLDLNGGVFEVSDTSLTLGTTDIIHVRPAGGSIKVDAFSALGTVNIPVVFTGAVPANFTVDFASATAVTGTYSALTGDTVLSSTAGLSIRTVTISGNPFSLTAGVTTTFTASDGVGGVLVCFLPGASIATPDGDRNVEDLREGDTVWALEHGERVARRIVWAGERTIDVAREPDPASVRPVRVAAGAFAPGVPHADLLVTPEHCFLFDGRLVPARMLVNERTITIEQGLGRFTVHHVETDAHSVIVANGAATESYLDTGNRSAFRQAGVVVSIAAARRSVRSWAVDAAAPLAVEADVVGPIWRALDERAEALGAPSVAPATRTTDPDLRIVTETGREIRPLYQRDGRAVFAVPGGTGRLRLASRASRPSDAIGPWVDDRRRLGVLVGEVALWTAGGRVLRCSHLGDASLEGWHGIEPGAHRWTDGAASLALTPMPEGATSVVVEIEIVAAGPYLAAAEDATVRLVA